jgi:hypothetical protein
VTATIIVAVVLAVIAVVLIVFGLLATMVV